MVAWPEGPMQYLAQNLSSKIQEIEPKATLTTETKGNGIKVLLRSPVIMSVY